MSKEVKLGLSLSVLIVIGVALVLKFRGTPGDKQIPIQPVADTAAPHKSPVSPSRADTPRPDSHTPRLAARDARTSDAPRPTPTPAPLKSEPASASREDVLLAGTGRPNSSSAASREHAPTPTSGENVASEVVSQTPSLRDLRMTSDDEPVGKSASTSPTTETPSSTPQPEALTGLLKSGSTAPASAATDYYQVREGDTYARIAQIHYGHPKYADFLKQANADIINPDGPLRHGVRIRIPPLPSDGGPTVSSSASAGSPRTPGTSGPTASGPKDTGRSGGNAPASSTGVKTYTVKPKDTFYSIAKRELGDASRWKELLKLNSELVDGEPTNLKPGQVLKLPNT